MVELIDIADIRKAYFIGIGGIGMSAIARFFYDRGVKVSGYDKTATALTHALSAEGIEIHYTDDASICPADADVIVYTPAIPKDNKIIAYCREQQMNLLKRSDILQVISKGTFNICIAGTHGKTTTSTMVAHILRDTGFGCNAFLGGISTNYHTNFWSDPNPVCVIEADEYDRSFLKLYPNIISVSSMDADHLDIYGTASAMEDAFIQFTGNLKTNGLLLTRKGLNREDEFKSTGHLTYALDDAAADIHAFSLQINNGSYVYGVKGKDWEMEGLRLNMGGMHNVENSLVAIAIAKHLGIEDEKIKSAVASFAGVKRRFEYIVRTSSIVYIDDYAHHPEELRALITGAKDMYPSKKCTIIFQPHLFSRTRDLVDGFAASLDLADEIILLPIYPARELPIEGVNSEMIMQRMKGKVVLKHMHELEALITEMQPELLLTAGAGDIDTLIQSLKNAMLNR
jgi:UDP-N-acetylmuramate--alanine ligase